MLYIVGLFVIARLFVGLFEKPKLRFSQSVIYATFPTVYMAGVIID